MVEESGIAGLDIEEIPDKDRLFMRVHSNNTKNGLLIPGAFKNHNDGMSTDWSKYSIPEQTRQRAKNPSRNGVIEMSVKDVRAIPGQRVQHTPIPSNRAHTDVLGEKDEESRVKFLRISRWAIPLE